MQCFNHYDVIIFDCDGVILNSNSMKITAMRSALKKAQYPEKKIEEAVESFLNNFGKSRQYHCLYFVETLLGLQGEQSHNLQKSILTHYTQSVEDEYLKVPMTEGSLALLQSLKNTYLYIASGSEEAQLIRTFKKRKLSPYFKGIFGSPETKSNNIKKIIAQHPKNKILFIGDAVADYQAAHSNNIDFIFYSPYSNVKNTMIKMSSEHHFQVIHSF